MKYLHVLCNNIKYLTFSRVFLRICRWVKGEIYSLKPLKRSTVFFRQENYSTHIKTKKNNKVELLQRT